MLGTGNGSSWPVSSRWRTSTPTASSCSTASTADEARRIYAGADLFLMPSRFEPCGQGQLIAMRYGTPPVVRRVGGLADTVIDADADPRAGTGFVFGPAEPGALVAAVQRAIAALADAARFRRIQAQGMTRDDSWAVPARQYEPAYQRALHRLDGRPLGRSCLRWWAGQSRMRMASTATWPLTPWTSRTCGRRPTGG